MKSSSAQLRAQFFRGNGLNFALALFACLLTAGLNLLIARVLQQMIDAVSGVPGAPGLGRLALLIGLILALIAAAKALEYYAKPRFLERAMRQYKDCAFGLLTQKSLAAFRGEDGAKYLSAFSNDAASVERGCLEGLFSLVSNAVLSLGALAMMLAYSPPMTAVSCAFFALPIAASLAAGGPRAHGQARRRAIRRGAGRGRAPRPARAGRGVQAGLLRLRPGRRGAARHLVQSPPRRVRRPRRRLRQREIHPPAPAHGRAR